MESNDRKNVYLSKNPDNSLNSGMRDTMIVNPGNIPPGNLVFIFQVFISRYYANKIFGMTNQKMDSIQNITKFPINTAYLLKGFLFSIFDRSLNAYNFHVIYH